MIPVLSYCDVPANEIFSPLAGSLNIAKEVAGVNVYWPQFGINTIGNLEPGNAYYLSLFNSGSITFEDCEQLKSMLISRSAKPEIAEPWGKISYSNNTHAIAIPLELMDGSELLQGDVLGVFSQEGLFVGGTEIQIGQGNHIMVFGEDLSEQQSSGIKNGSEMVFKVYRPGTDQVFDTQVEFMEGIPQQGIFITNGVSAFKSIRLTEMNKNSIRVFPNPTSGTINIDCGSYENTMLNVYNMYGKHIMSRQLSTGSFSISIGSTLTAGVYNFEFSNEAINHVKRVVIR